MTMRYQCVNRVKSHSFSGYNALFMKQLQLRLKADISAVLTYRSGISKALSRLMRPSFQHGIGPHRLSKILRVMHTEKYDILQLQYYAAVDYIVQNSPIINMFTPDRGKQFDEFSKFKDKKLYNGYIPSAGYISFVYISNIENLRPMMDQVITMLDGIVLKGDHSFKIIDHMTKVNGVSTFSYLYTLLNEYEEIRLQVLSHSKSMENLSQPFLDMMSTYSNLGMKLPELFYTDNVIGDQGFLKDVILSLNKDVVPVEPKAKDGEDQLQKKNYPHFPIAALPNNVFPSVISSPNLIDEACRFLLLSIVIN